MAKAFSPSNFFLPYGRGQIEINLEGIVSKEDLAKLEWVGLDKREEQSTDAGLFDELLKEALKHPIKSEALSDLIHSEYINRTKSVKQTEHDEFIKGTKSGYCFTIGIVIDDYTRKPPNQNILKNLIEALDAIELSSINSDSANSDSVNSNPNNSDSANSLSFDKVYKIFIACGTHRPPTPAELETDYLKPLLNRTDVKIIPVSSKKSGQYNQQFAALRGYKLVGTTKAGTEVRIFKKYIECDFKITISDILFHYFAGFGGGRKSVFPGLGEHIGINHNHKMATMEGVAPAKLAGNPVNEDMEEAANFKECRPDFTINYVSSAGGNIIKLFCGDLNAAFREGAAWYKERFSIKIPEEERADLVILSCGGYPYDINYYQSLKALHHSKNACKPGGTIIFITECGDKIGNDVFASISEKFSSTERKTLEKDCDLEKIKEYIRKDFKQGLNSFYFQRKFASDYDIYLYSSFETSNAGNGNYIPKSWGIKGAFCDKKAKSIEMLSNLICDKLKNAKKGFVIPEGSKYLIINQSR